MAVTIPMTRLLVRPSSSSRDCAPPTRRSEVTATVSRQAEKFFRWDLDKTYLVSHFESLRGLLAVPFEKGVDKVALPGVAAVIKGLHRNEERHGRNARVFFLSASPPQIGAAIREKLAIDGIRYEGITFKDQVAHLVRGRFDALREQIGYKLDQLLAAAESIPPRAVELLFGDDWESDPFVYSLYSDVLARSSGIPKHDAFHLYLGYHEGPTGYQRRSFDQKPWLFGVSSARESWRMAASAPGFCW